MGIVTQAKYVGARLPKPPALIVTDAAETEGPQELGIVGECVS
jgi:hypothetical protein